MCGRWIKQVNGLNQVYQLEWWWIRARIVLPANKQSNPVEIKVVTFEMC